MTSPYYFINKEGRLQRKGSFLTGRSFITRVYRGFISVKEKSRFLQLANVNLPLRISQRHIQLTFEIIAESKRQYEKQFDGTFYVLILPGASMQYRYVAQLVDLLEADQIDVLYFSPPGDFNQYIIDNEVHFNMKLNKFLSEQIAEYLNRKTYTK